MSLPQIVRTRLRHGSGRPSRPREPPFSNARWIRSSRSSETCSSAHLPAHAFDAIRPVLGELHEELGDSTRAACWYGEFVTLWEDADPELQPQVSDVRGRMARLIGR